VRTVALEPHLHALLVHDRFDAVDAHLVEIPYHFAAGIEPGEPQDDSLTLGSFVLRWRSPQRWDVALEDSWISPSYGVRRSARRVVFRRDGSVAPLTVVLAPADTPQQQLWSWAEEAAS
jgi:hypothetical protein